MERIKDEKIKKDEEDKAFKEATLTEKQKAVRKLRAQNDTLKKELKTLSSKLEEFVNASRLKRHKQIGLQNAQQN